jgi:hypothetical protein
MLSECKQKYENVLIYFGLSVVSVPVWVVSCQLSVVSLSVVSCRLLVVSYQLSVISYQLSVIRLPGIRRGDPDQKENVSDPAYFAARRLIIRQRNISF